MTIGQITILIKHIFVLLENNTLSTIPSTDFLLFDLSLFSNILIGKIIKRYIKSEEGALGKSVLYIFKYESYVLHNARRTHLG